MEHLKPDRRTDKRKLGDLGEGIACDYLIKHGFRVIERNYLRKWGEIDIVASRDNLIRFIEVKSVSCESLAKVTPETGYRPEDNVHPGKLLRLSRTIQTYLLDRDVRGDWQLDVMTVRIEKGTNRAQVETIENVII